MASTKQPVSLWIDNTARESDIVFPVRNHGTGTSTTAYGVTPEVAKNAVDSCHRAFPKWKATTPWERRDLFFKAASLLEQQRTQVADLLTLETPVDDFTVHAINIQLSIDLLRELGSQILTSFEGTILPSKQSTDSIIMVVKEPIGVQLAIAPWNASLFLAMRSVATPIACGNPAVLKASEISPAVHNFIGTLFAEAGFPPGVLNVIQHRREDAAAILDVLISDDRIRKVNFTGSTTVGKIVAAKAAQNCKPVLLELGGKSPQIVLKDADLDKAAQAAALGAFSHHGQICMSTERVIVDESILDTFGAKMLAVMQSLDLQPGATVENASRVVKLVTDAVAQGAQYVGGESIRQNGSRLSPCILTNVTPSMEIWNNETFAPVTILVPFKGLDEAIRMANDSSFGLSSSIFTSNVARAMAIARELESGAVHINSMTVHDEAHMAHGGVKSSGWGRFGVPWGFSEFTQTKTITISDDNFGGGFHE